MKRRSLRPIIAAPCVVGRRTTEFLRAQDTVSLEAPRDLIYQLARYCDGLRTLEEVIRQLSDEWDVDSVRGLIGDLQRRDIIVDSRALAETQWVIVENPTQFPSELSEADVDSLVEKAASRHKANPTRRSYQVPGSTLTRQLEKRESVRSFSGRPISFTSLLQMLWCAYGATNQPLQVGTKNLPRRTVPSAGALYPLTVSLVLFKKVKDLRPGVYRIWMGAPRKVGFSLVSRDTDAVLRAYADPLMPEGSTGIVFLSGSFGVSGEKYANRSILYVTLEAGHAAQNIHLAAIDNGVSTVEVGGFIEELASIALGLPSGFQPLTSIIFGKERTQREQADKVINEPEVHWAVPKAGTYVLPFNLAFTRVPATANEDWACGRAVSPRLARTKAVNEAREWAACAFVPDTAVKGRFDGIKSAVDPRTIISFHQAQYRSKDFPFKPLGTHIEYTWVEGRDELSGSRRYVLADCVYFPYYPKTPPYAQANSSGVAARPRRTEAIKHGVLELIERDAFMNAYLGKLSLPTIKKNSFPQRYRTRIDTLTNEGFTVWVKDYSLDLAPVVFVFAQSDHHSYTTCAACADFDVENALDHALMEVESSVLCRLANGPAEPIKPSQIRFPSDHGRLYEQRRYFQKSDHLVRSNRTISFSEVGRGRSRSWSNFLDRLTAKGLSLITVRLDLPKQYQGRETLKIVRSIIPGLVPMSFGYLEEPCGMRRIPEIAKIFAGKSIYYKDMPRFPHPYT